MQIRIGGSSNLTIIEVGRDSMLSTLVLVNYANTSDNRRISMTNMFSCSHITLIKVNSTQQLGALFQFQSKSLSTWGLALWRTWFNEMNLWEHLRICTKSGKIDQSLKPLKKSNQEEYSINVSTSLRIKIRFSIHVSEKTTVRLILYSTRQKMKVSMEDLMNYREFLL